RRHTRFSRDWSSDVCSSDLVSLDEVQGVRGSTRLEAKKQRRREGRELGRRRSPIITESEFLARRESVERVMVVRRRGGRTQIAEIGRASCRGRGWICAAGSS